MASSECPTVLRIYSKGSTFSLILVPTALQNFRRPLGARLVRTADASTVFTWTRACTPAAMSGQTIPVRLFRLRQHPPVRRESPSPVVVRAVLRRSPTSPSTIRMTRSGMRRGHLDWECTPPRPRQGYEVAVKVARVPGRTGD